MKNEPQQPPRRQAQTGARRRGPSAASAILKGSTATVAREDYFSPQWILLWLTLLTISLIAFLFTPYTHQLDEIKNVILMFCPPFLLIGALVMKNFRAINWRTQGATILLGLFFVDMVFSFLINDYKMIGERVIWFWTGCATFTVVFAWFMNSELKMRRTMLFWTLLGLASTIIGLLLFAGQGFTKIIYEFMKNDVNLRDSPWTTLFFTLQASRSDMYSFVLNTDFYAAFLVMTLPIPLAMFFAEQRTVYRVLALITFLLMNVCLILTNSNDSYPSILVGYLLFFALYMLFVRGWRFSWGAMITALIYIVALVAEVDLLLNIALKILTTSDGSYIRIFIDLALLAGCMSQVSNWRRQQRFLMVLLMCVGVLIAEVALLMLPTVASTWAFKSAAFEGRKVLWAGDYLPWIYGHDRTKTHFDFVAILFGEGPGSYRHFFPWFRRPDFFDQQINNVTTFGHNWYLDLLLETGAVGLILFMWFHFRVLKDAFHQIRTTHNRTHLLYQVAIVCGLAGIAIQNFTSPNNRWAVAGMTYWAMFGLSMGVSRLEHRGEDERATGQHSPMALGAKIAAILFAVIFMVESSFQQAGLYWKAATNNATGLKFMDAAQSPEVSKDQQDQYLGVSQRLFEQAIQQNPTFATSYYKLGNVYNSLGQTDKAIATYELLNKISPSYSEIYLNLGIMYYVEASEKEQEPDALRKEAEKKLSDAAKARTDERQKLRDEAAQYMEQAKSLEAELPKVKLKLYEKSYESLQEAARQSVKPNVQALAADQGRELATEYDAIGEHEKAAAIREEIKKYYWTILTYEPKLDDVIAERKKKYPIAEERLLQLSQTTDKPGEAEPVLKRMIVENPDKPQYLLTLIKLYDQQAKTGEKIAYLENAVHDNPVDQHLRSMLADAYAKSGDNAKYVAELRRLEVLKPGDPMALSGLYLAYKTQEPAKASEYADKLQKIGVKADDLTTIIKEGASTASMNAAKVRAPKPPVLEQQTTAPDMSTNAPPVAAKPVETPEPAETPKPVETTPAPKAEAPATSVTAASASVTAPAPVVQTPAPGIKSSDAPVTAPSAESSTSATK